MVVGICRVKDEADIIGPVVRHMLDQVDHVIVEDNGSTDATLDILADHPVEVLQDPTVGYYQSAAMTRLAAHAAREHQASIVVPFDADEIWTSPAGRLADVLSAHPDTAIFTAALYDHVATGQDADEPDPVARLAWRRRTPGELPKVACRPQPAVTIHQGNHAADYGRTRGGLLTVHHYPYRSPEQVIRKVRNGAAAYAATDLPDHLGAHWRQWGQILHEHGEDAIRALFHKWFYRARPDRPVTIDGEQQPALTYDPQT